MCDEQMGCVRTSFCRNSRSGSVGGTDSGSSIRLSSRVDLAPGRRRRRRSSARYRCAVRSMKRDGQSLSEVAKKEMGPVAGFCTGLAMLFIITITMAGLSMVVLNALEKKNPWGTFAVGMTIPIAMGVGLYYKKTGNLKGASIVGIILVMAAVLFGPWIKDTVIGQLLTFNKSTLALILLSTLSLRRRFPCGCFSLQGITSALL